MHPPKVTKNEKTLKERITSDMADKITLTLAAHHLEASVSKFPYYIYKNHTISGVEGSTQEEEAPKMGY